MKNTEEGARGTADSLSARRALEEQKKEPFQITGALDTDLQEVCEALRMDEEKVIAFGLGILLKAIDVKGEIHIVDDRGKTIYRSKKMGL